MIKKTITKIAYLMTLIIAFALINSCSPPYQRFGIRGGYYEKKLSYNKFKISFVGNAYLARYKARDFALLRSAEVADKNHFKFFIVESISKFFVYSSSTFVIMGYNEIPTQKPIAKLEEEPKEQVVYDTKKVIIEMRKKHLLPPKF